jgi:type IX secretion system PorP/SprF family membrane protein
MKAGKQYMRRIKPAMFFIMALIGLIAFKNSTYAQDIHFSQFYTTPLLTNSANTGMSGENLRVAINYRNQWTKLGVPFKTLYTSIDKKLLISDETFGVGGVIIHDKSSAYNLLVDAFLLSFSYSKIINNQQFTVGVQPGFVYKSYDPNGLTFGTQFDETSQLYNPSLPSSESTLTGNLHYFDLNVGIFWRTIIRTVMPSVGVSISHINRPLQTFSTASSGIRLPIRYTFSSQVIIPFSNRFDITPQCLYGYMSGASELLVGGLEGYTVNNFVIPVKKIYAITMFRSNPFRNIGAVILGAGVKFTKFDLGLTYDSNVSTLSRFSNFNGAFEISLLFTGGAQKRGNDFCRIY